MQKYSVGIDIGGTFTDIVMQNADGSERHVHKILTTKNDPADAVIEGFGRLLNETGIEPSRISRVVHATTLFTNALIERKGVATGLLTTSGFGDLLEIGRERKYDLYDLYQRKPAPLVPRAHCIEIDERLAPDGTVEIELNIDAVATAVAELVEQGVEAIAIMFLHAFANPEHERRAAAWIRERHPEVFVSVSTEVSPIIREYERLSTTVANAYIGPLAEAYLDDLSFRIQELGIDTPFFIMTSNGGVNSVAEAKRIPVQLLESGPAAGALAGAHFGAIEGAEQVLAFDMGGTTAKLCIIDRGEPVIAHSFEASREKRFRDGSGLPISISTVELIEIGAGGGSIATTDQMGLIKVGPRSAGAEPGPACYGRGGTEPTVTDANLSIGTLNPEYFLGGAMTIDRQASDAALVDLGLAVALDVSRVATGVLEIVTESMASAARVHTAERAYDPRSCTLLATGGAGPLHAFAIARKLGIRSLVCPPCAGVGSAVGLLMAPARADRSTTFPGQTDTIDIGKLERAFEDLERDARAIVLEAGGIEQGIEIRRHIDMRYVGQGFELTVPIAASNGLDGAELRAAFERVYDETFQRILPQSSVELVNLRVTVLAPVTEDDMGAQTESKAPAAADPSSGRRPVWFGPEGATDTAVYSRYDLPFDQVFDGPAIVEEAETTILIGPSSRFVRRSNGNVVVTLD